MKLNLKNRHKSGLNQAVSFIKLIIGIGVILVFLHVYLKYGFDSMKIFNFWIEYINYYNYNLMIWGALSVIGSFVVYVYFFVITKQKIKIQEMIMMNHDDLDINKFPGVIKMITLAELSKIWMPPLEREKQRKEEEKNMVDWQIEQKTELLRHYFFEKKETLDLINQYIETYLHIILLNDLHVILDLLKFLEEHGGCASVSGYRKDPESEKLSLQTDGTISSFDIAKTFSLFDHSLRVVKHIIKILKGSEIEDIEGWKLKIGKALIIALGHDIGKVQSTQIFERTDISISLKHSMTHAILSKMMFMTMFSEYDNVDEIAEYIENHHTSRKDLGAMGVMLVNADKNARKEEKKLWETDKNRIDAYQIQNDGLILKNCIVIEDINTSDNSGKQKNIDLDIFGLNKKALKPDISPVSFDFGKIESQFKEAIFHYLNTFMDKTFIPGCASVNNRIVINIELFKKILIELLYIGDVDDIDGYIKYAISILNSYQYAPIQNMNPNNPYLSRYKYSSKNNKRYELDIYCVELECEYIDMGMEMLQQHKKSSPLKNIILEKCDLSI
jgi:hypothetical protein